MLYWHYVKLLKAKVVLQRSKQKVSVFCQLLALFIDDICDNFIWQVTSKYNVFF